MRTNEQRITMIRCVEVQFFGQRVMWWEGGGKRFMGKACHMKALKAAREAGAHHGK